MVNKQIFAEIEKNRVPAFNPTVCNGLAVSHIKQVERYIDNIFRCAEVGLPEGLVYRGYSRCTPQEEYNVMSSRRNNNRRCIEMSRSDVYLVKYNFSFHGEELRPRFLYLPFVSDGAMIRVLGATFNISPILADKAISVGVDSIFIPLNRDKLTFKRLTHAYLVDGERRENHNIIWSKIHHPPEKRGRETSNRRMVVMSATPAHYLFCKYGVTEAFRRFANVDVRIGYEDINKTNHPADQWVIYSSTRLRPRGVKDKQYFPTNLKMAVPRSVCRNNLVEGMVGAFFYLADHFPDRIHAEEIDEPTLWMVLMGHIELEPGIGEGKMLNGITSHIESLDDYIDGMVKGWLADDGIVVNDIYELFAYIIETMPEAVAQSSTQVASMYGKRLTVLRYLLSDIITAIFKWMFELRKKSKQGSRILTKKDVMDSMQKHLRPELITRVNQKHVEVAGVSSPTDNKLFKITSAVIQQSSSTSHKPKQNRSYANDPSKILHASVAEIGSLNNLPKSEPTGRSRLNPFVQTNPDGTVRQNPELKGMLDRLQESINR